MKTSLNSQHIVAWGDLGVQELGELFLGGRVGQSIEYSSCKRRVLGSIPDLAALFVISPVTILNGS